MLGASGVETWQVRVAFADGTENTCLATAEGLANQVEQLQGLSDRYGAQIAIQPAGTIHPLVVLEGLDTEQLSRLRAELGVPTALRLGPGRNQIWLRLRRPLGPGKRKQKIDQLVRRYGGYEAQPILAGFQGEPVSIQTSKIQDIDELLKSMQAQIPQEKPEDFQYPEREVTRSVRLAELER